MEFLKCRDVRWKRREKRNKPNVVATTAKHPDSRRKISLYGLMQPTYMRSVSFWGKFTSGSCISASLPIMSPTATKCMMQKTGKYWIIYSKWIMSLICRCKLFHLKRKADNTIISLKYKSSLVFRVPNRFNPQLPFIMSPTAIKGMMQRTGKYWIIYFKWIMSLICRCKPFHLKRKADNTIISLKYEFDR